MSKPKQQKNFGLKHKQPDKKDYKLGQDDGFYSEIENEQADWSDYLPKTELQKRYGLETMMCVSASNLNVIEILHKYQYEKEVNYSDRFLAKISNTTKQGNWYKDVAQAIRDHGLVKEEGYPWPKTVDTWQEFYQEIPQEIKDKAKKFNDKYNYFYQWVGTGGVNNARLNLGLKYSPLQVSLYAWGSKDSNGVYQCPDWVTSARDTNHAVTLFKIDDKGRRHIFDQYEQEVKILAEDYYISSAMGHSLTKKIMFKTIKGDQDEDIFAVSGDDIKHHIPTEYCFDKGAKLGLWSKDFETKPQQEVDQLETGDSIVFVPSK